jgi:hypothetical protein
MLPVRVLPLWVQVSVNVPATWSGVTSCQVPVHDPPSPAEADADDAGGTEGMDDEVVVGAADGWAGGSDAGASEEGDGLNGGWVAGGEAVAVQAATARTSAARTVAQRRVVRIMGPPSRSVGRRSHLRYRSQS